ncbi:DUF1758 domain-containing protein [Trichonephila clavipes]|nr:DUF1758 domain-containing protein [Trichonephila clavipes]
MSQEMLTGDVLAYLGFEDQPLLSHCRKLSEKRLINYVRPFERTKNFRKLEAVFHRRLDEDIIVEVHNDADMKNEHYLPLHPVYKDNATNKTRLVFDGSEKEKNSYSINECLTRAKYVTTNSNNHQ